MKKICWIVFTMILPVVILCSSCKKYIDSGKNTTKENVIESENKNSNSLEDDEVKTEYIYRENEFKASYEKALKEVEDGYVPNALPPTEDNNDFAVIPLNGEIYGVDNFAILPVLKRQLTEEEILQLAYSMNGIMFEQLINSSHSWMGLDDQLLYRSYQWEERIMDYELEILYRYEGIRPENPLTKNQLNNGPLYIDLQWPEDKSEGFFRYWIYPKNTMTKEQILQIIDIKFGKIPTQYYQPLAEQIPYVDVAKTGQQLVHEYGASDYTVDTAYAYYWSTRGTPSTPIDTIRDMWTARLHFTKGNDYEVIFNAGDGSFISWTCYPPGYFGEKEPSDFLKKDNMDTVNHTDEEMLEAAKTFITNKLLKDGVTIKESYLETLDYTPRFFSEYYGKGKIAVITLSTGDIYNVSVMENDLLIQKLQKN